MRAFVSRPRRPVKHKPELRNHETTKRHALGHPQWSRDRSRGGSSHPLRGLPPREPLGRHRRVDPLLARTSRAARGQARPSRPRQGGAWDEAYRFTGAAVTGQRPQAVAPDCTVPDWKPCTRHASPTVLHSPHAVTTPPAVGLQPQLLVALHTSGVLGTCPASVGTTQQKTSCRASVVVGASGALASVAGPSGEGPHATAKTAKRAAKRTFGALIMNNCNRLPMQSQA